MLIKQPIKQGAARYLPPFLIALVASVLLLWHLDRKYLWEDEANTAVLATRMLKTGKPLSYDGVNFIGLDNSVMEQEEPIEWRTGNASAVVDYYLRHGYMKEDSTWKWHPWGQFVVAAISIKLLGQTTLAARLPFALAGIVTVLLLYRLALLCFAGELIAQAAALLLTLNAYWILHERQCRYYSLSSLFLVTTMLSYARWQRERRWGVLLFIASAWCWFQVDYGTFWPVLAVLSLDALAAHWRRPRKTLMAGAVLAASIAPFVWYYELWGRRGAQNLTLWQRFTMNLFNTNEYLLPATVGLAAIVLLVLRRKALPAFEFRMLAISCGVVCALGIWVPMMTVEAFVRYIIMAAPLGCLVTAWVVVRAIPGRIAWCAWPAFAVLAFTPLASEPLSQVNIPPPWYHSSWYFRSELTRTVHEVFGAATDVNGPVIAWLKANAKPSDEILINYEDVPLMYYLPNPIRGGIAAFRVEDDSVAPPRFLVFRPVPFTNMSVFQHESRRYVWAPVGVNVPMRLWGNNPDPMSDIEVPNGIYLIFRRRLDGDTPR